jgi:hypothetical protein
MYERTITMRIRVFGRKNCAKCETTKNKINHMLDKGDFQQGAMLEFHDLDTADGMAEGAYNDIVKIPTTIIDKEDDILARWEGEVPKSADIRKLLAV